MVDFTKDLKIHSIEVENYRQFYGKQKIDFNVKGNKLFSIIQAENGVGKSNLLNAFNWCFYQKEPHLKDESMSLPLINSRAYAETEIGTKLQCEVIVTIGDDTQALYEIKRTLRGQKNGTSTEVINSSTYGLIPKDFTPYLFTHFAKWDEVNGWIPDEYFDNAINLLLPQKLSSFFFFDGEALQQFFNKGLGKVKDGIETISQITLMETATKHLHSVALEYRRASEGFVPEADAVQQEIARIVEFRQKVEQDLRSYVTRLEPISDRLAYVRGELRNSNLESVRRDQKRREELQADIKRLTEEIDELKQERISKIVSAGPGAYLFECINFTLTEIAKKVDKKALPPPISEQFCQKILKSGECICGINISKDVKKKEKIKKLLDTSKLSNIVRLTTKGQYILEQMVSHLGTLVSDLEKYRIDIRNIDEIKEKKKSELEDIRTRLSNINEQTIAELESEREAKEKLEEQLKSKIAIARNDMDRAKKEEERLSKTHDQELKKSSKLDTLRKRILLCENAEKILEDLRKELLNEVRRDVEGKTKKHFLELIWKKDTFIDVKIDQDYKISVFHKDGYVATGSLSVGETMFLALAFISALRDITGFRFPIIIDTPLKGLSGVPKMNAAKHLPEYLPSTQIILLVTGVEYSDPITDDHKTFGSFRALIKDKVGTEYKMVYDEKNTQTMVNNFEN
ncbi:MAG: AAA family ATPase [Candidatus Nitrosotenuis sp.]